MLSLQPHHITDLYVWVDDLLSTEARPRGGRPALLKDSELVTILLWNTLAVGQKTLKDIHKWILLYHRNDFPHIPKYSAFVDHCHRIMPLLWNILECCFAEHAEIRFMDSTMVPVCKLVRADSHKICRNIAQFGKNHQGWHYGFKLHASVDGEGRFCGLVLTPANTHDAQRIPYLVNKYTKIAVGDTSYGARVMREHIWETCGTIILAPPHPTQKTKVLTGWQYVLLRMRPKIESVFDYLKEHLHFVTSFPRSVKGYLLHYLRILLGYQLMVM